MTATIERLALNNALWCASVLRSGGGEGHFGPTLWWSVGPAPRYYPRAVTLARALDEGARQRLARLAPGDAVKDSFLALDPTGFDTLFVASWYHRPPDPAPGEADHGDADTIGSIAAEGLAAWVEAWGGGEGILVPALLQQPGVTFLALSGPDGPVAGCTLFHAAGVVGLSNLFGGTEQRAALLRAAAGRAGPLPLATYAAREEGQALQAAGFQPLGPLRVLVKT